MVAALTEKRLLIGDEWVDTGEWIDVRSPYSGDVVGRVAKAGADHARQAVDAAAKAMQEPLPAHKRAEILVKVAAALGRRHDEVARLISDESAFISGAEIPVDGGQSAHGGAKSISDLLREGTATT